MSDELQTAGSPVEQLRSAMHSDELDAALDRGAPSSEQARVTADWRARVLELGEDALASGDEQLAVRVLRLRGELADLP